MKSEEDLRTEMITVARSLFARGYSFGTAGNLSVRCGGALLVTPTGSSMETVAAGDLAQVDIDGRLIGRTKPSKEVHFHLAIYRARADVGAVVHLHSIYAVALSCLKALDMEDALPVLTPYYAMRVGRLPVVEYLPPGDPRLAPEVEARAAAANAILLQNHGPITMGRDLAEAAALAEELEEQAKLFFLLGERGRTLTAAEVRILRERFG
jgi:ribulose-5-phosphate 4-epimerase/fuculose-1-phosphate aldolase